MNKKEYVALKSIVSRKQYKFVIFDFFDTLVSRKYGISYSFYYVSNQIARYVIGDINFNEIVAIVKKCYETEDYSVLKNQLYDIHINFFFASFDSFKAYCDNLMLEAEMRNTSVNPYVIDLLSFLNNNSFSISILSDFYFGSKFINKLVEHHFKSISFQNIIVSKDYGKRKSNGLLYSVLNNYVDCNTSLVIGDNYYSDYVNAKNNHFDAFLLNAKKQYKKYRQFDNKYNYYIDKMLDNMIYTNVDYYSCNYIFAIFLYCKKMYLMLENGVTIFFLSREGKFLKQCFDNYLNSVLNVKGIKTKYLSISRIAMYLLDDDFISLDWDNAFKVLQNVYSVDELSIASFLEMLDFNYDEVNDVIGDIDGKTLKDVWNNPIFKAIVNKKIKVWKNKLLFDIGEPDRLIITDVGWNGTMQDLLFKNLGKNVTGYYLGLRRESESQNNFKVGLVFNCKNSNYLFNRDRVIQTFEALLRSSEPYLFCYGGTKDHYVDDGSIQVYNEYSLNRQTIMLELFNILISIEKELPITYASLDRVFKKIMYKRPFKCFYIDRYYFELQKKGHVNNAFFPHRSRLFYFLHTPFYRLYELLVKMRFDR